MRRAAYLISLLLSTLIAVIVPVYMTYTFLDKDFQPIKDKYRDEEKVQIIDGHKVYEIVKIHDYTSHVYTRDEYTGKIYKVNEAPGHWYLVFIPIMVLLLQLIILTTYIDYVLDEWDYLDSDVYGSEYLIYIPFSFIVLIFIIINKKLIEIKKEREERFKIRNKNLTITNVSS